MKRIYLFLFLLIIACSRKFDYQSESQAVEAGYYEGYKVAKDSMEEVLKKRCNLIQYLEDKGKAEDGW